MGMTAGKEKHKREGSTAFALPVLLMLISVTCSLGAARSALVSMDSASAVEASAQAEEIARTWADIRTYLSLGSMSAVAGGIQFGGRTYFLTDSYAIPYSTNKKQGKTNAEAAGERAYLSTSAYVSPSDELKAEGGIEADINTSLYSSTNMMNPTYYYPTYITDVYLMDDDAAGMNYFSHYACPYPLFTYAHTTTLGLFRKSDANDYYQEVTTVSAVLGDASILGTRTFSNTLGNVGTSRSSTSIYYTKGNNTVVNTSPPAKAFFVATCVPYASGTTYDDDSYETTNALTVSDYIDEDDSASYIQLDDGTTYDSSVSSFSVPVTYARNDTTTAKYLKYNAGGRISNRDHSVTIYPLYGKYYSGSVSFKVVSGTEETTYTKNYESTLYAPLCVFSIWAWEDE